MPQHIHPHFRQLDIAREALDLGARRSVVQQITGISEQELRRVFGNCPALTTNHGGRPSSIDKLLRVRELHIQASDFYNGFHHVFHRGVPPDEALLVSYRRYKGRHGDDVRLSFDRAFSVVTSVFRLWSTAAPTLKPFRCHQCGALYLAPVWASASDPSPCAYCHFTRWFSRRKPKHPDPADLVIGQTLDALTPSESLFAGIQPLQVTPNVH